MISVKKFINKTLDIFRQKFWSGLREDKVEADFHMQIKHPRPIIEHLLWYAFF